MAVLVLNSGSSSLRFALFDDAGARRLAGGHIERIGEDAARLTWSLPAGGGQGPTGDAALAATDHGAALGHVLAALPGLGIDAVHAVGHRVVHGGSDFADPVRVDDDVLARLAALDRLAPLHNPGNRLGIEVARRQFPAVPQVAVFDTAFHRTLPPHAAHYALPASLGAELGIRRYGFHGTSHAGLARRVATLMARPLASLRLVTLHLGNGASAAAIDGGRSVDTSMGFSPLEGLVMGTRSGDLDASIPLFLQHSAGLDAAQVERLLTEQSGLLGLAGARDMRDIERRRAAGDARATLAFDMFCYRVRKYLGAYQAVLGQLDAVVFAGGIGENSVAVRHAVCSGLDALGIVLDAARNAAASPDAAVHADGSPTQVWVLRADEEGEIARQTVATLADLET